ncbi:type II secretion system minor pseudopilin GspK [Celerinatantimonas diazotrophica]|uniref:Type II secretion system protein K n=1 Tax=Celerinatantimonas diazotrophica TaxID=412034 RepID=A0A4R1KF13_9GAMM|nr:type II secretion system minor pseudopilin GspK [Celerinatantimonas diazotrophica]TCK62747.1 type II secretion system protein K (GspK) [Celerinatantimonas diazotrophica]CAG9298377.1 hypothetical protein CEDIAZO_03577 [Celerinatantimonas diazotrophica]
MIKHHRQQGVALLIVLLIITIMVVLASKMALTGRMDIARLNDVKTQSDNWQRLLSAEQLALSVLRDSMRDSTRLSLNQKWAKQVTLPVDGGSIRGQIVDASRCFNLNALGQPNDASGQSMVQTLFYRLLVIEKVPAQKAQMIAAATRDWVDSHSHALAGGGEDEVYQDAGYKAPNTMLVDVSQWREVRGVDEQIYRRLSPLLCALPTQRLRIDINTLQSAQAPLLEMLFYGYLTREKALKVIAQRPSRGFQTVDQIFTLPELAKVKLMHGVHSVLAVTSYYFVAKMQARSDDGTQQVLYSFIERQGSDKFNVRRRMLGDWH